MAALHEAVREMCKSLLPDPNPEVGQMPPLRSKMTFDFPQPDNKPSKHVVANVDFEGTEAIWQGLCRIGFVTSKFHGWDNVIGAQIDKGNICMKEGGKGEEDWLVLGWDQGLLRPQGNKGPITAAVSMKFE